MQARRQSLSKRRSGHGAIPLRRRHDPTAARTNSERPDTPVQHQFSSTLPVSKTQSPSPSRSTRQTTITAAMSSEKRPADEYGQLVVKRQKPGVSTALAQRDGGANGALIAAPRTSNLDSHLMELTGHTGEVFTTKFNPSGQFIASGSMDRSICALSERAQSSFVPCRD